MVLSVLKLDGLLAVFCYSRFFELSLDSQSIQFQLNKIEKFIANNFFVSSNCAYFFDVDRYLRENNSRNFFTRYMMVMAYRYIRNLKLLELNGKKSHFSVSSSHAFDAAAVLITVSSYVCSVGIDVEHSSRVISPRVLNFISNNQDKFSENMSPLEIWTLKEAFFKSFNCVKSMQDINVQQCDGLNVFHSSFNEEFSLGFIIQTEDDHNVSVAFSMLGVN